MVSPYLGRLCQIFVQSNFLSIPHPFSSTYLMPSHCTHLGISQREISHAADTTTRLYYEATPEDRRSALEIWDTMTKAQDRLIKSIRTKNFEKYISVAHKDNGEDFFQEEFPLPIHWFYLL